MSSESGKTAGAGTLYIVGTPIGNMEDITLRALRVLRDAGLVAAEDTRHTGLLLARHAIRKALVSYHEFNEAKRTPELLRVLQQGRSIALVSDAGMPSVSDPGQRLIRAAIDAGIHVEVIPGVSAVTAALAAATPAADFCSTASSPTRVPNGARSSRGSLPCPTPSSCSNHPIALSSACGTCTSCWAIAAWSSPAS
jgi:precorrin-3B methylase